MCVRNIDTRYCTLNIDCRFIYVFVCTFCCFVADFCKGMDRVIGKCQGGVFNCGGLHWVEGLKFWEREKERDTGGRGRGIKFLFQLFARVRFTGSRFA
jgi:hypothetical protein